MNAKLIERKLTEANLPATVVTVAAGVVAALAVFGLSMKSMDTQRAVEEALHNCGDPVCAQYDAVDVLDALRGKMALRNQNNWNAQALAHHNQHASEAKIFESVIRETRRV